MKVSEEEHERWKTFAQASGMSFNAWARDKLNSIHVPLPIEAGIRKEVVPVSPLQPPMKLRAEGRARKGECLNRLPKGSYCKQCGKMH